MDIIRISILENSTMENEPWMKVYFLDLLFFGGVCLRIVPWLDHYRSERGKSKRIKNLVPGPKKLCGGFKYFLFSSPFGEDSHFD